MNRAWNPSWLKGLNLGYLHMQPFKNWGVMEYGCGAQMSQDGTQHHFDLSQCFQKCENIQCTSCCRTDNDFGNHCQFRRSRLRDKARADVRNTDTSMWDPQLYAQYGSHKPNMDPGNATWFHSLLNAKPYPEHWCTLSTCRALSTLCIKARY